MTAGAAQAPRRPLDGLRVVEMSQMVMGPTCGVILADLGADVVKIEPLKGDRTRDFGGPAAGFFPTYSRNKRSLAVEIGTPAGREIVETLIARSDVFIENFRPGLMQRSGLDYGTLSGRHPALIYCSLKGYLPGPYEHRLALDEVVQMMGGLAYMTGPPGQPLRAGASVNDVMGGMFGVIAIQAALAERARTGRGAHIQSALFENVVFLMGQQMMYETVTGQKSVTLAVKNSPWPVYDLFDTADDRKIFITIVGDEQWTAFCRSFGRAAWLDDPRLQSMRGRVDNRAWIVPEIAGIVRQWTWVDLAARLEALDLPYAPVNAPGDLFDDPHLASSGGLMDITLTDGRPARTPALPVSLDGVRLPNRRDPPQIGEHTQEVLSEIGYTSREIEALAARRVVRLGAS